MLSALPEKSVWNVRAISCHRGHRGKVSLSLPWAMRSDLSLRSIVVESGEMGLSSWRISVLVAYMAFKDVHMSDARNGEF